MACLDLRVVPLGWGRLGAESARAVVTELAADGVAGTRQHFDEVLLLNDLCWIMAEFALRKKHVGAY